MYCSLVCAETYCNVFTTCLSHASTADRDKFDAIDHDNDHRLQLAEFKEGCALVLPELQLNADAVASEFRKMDKNGGGKRVSPSGLISYNCQKTLMCAIWRFVHTAHRCSAVRRILPLGSGAASRARRRAPSPESAVLAAGGTKHIRCPTVFPSS